VDEEARNAMSEPEEIFSSGTSTTRLRIKLDISMIR